MKLRFYDIQHLSKIRQADEQLYEHLFEQVQWKRVGSEQLATESVNSWLQSLTLGATTESLSCKLCRDLLSDSRLERPPKH